MDEGSNPIEAAFGDSSVSSRKWLYITLITLTIVLLFAFVVWIVWYRPYDVSFGAYLLLILQSIISIILWPIKVILSALGLWREGSVTVPPLLPPSNVTTTQIVKHEISECPPCNCTCECPECKELDTKPYEAEIKYLKDMVRLIGSIARRENAINSQYRDLYPGFSVMSPHVRKLTTEYNLMKEELRKDDDEWQYFKNYFTKLSGIPSDTNSYDTDE